MELAACGLWVVGFAGETTADRQRLRFTTNPANRGLQCRTGLWRYGRRPDRLFEAMMWAAFTIFGLTAIQRVALNVLDLSTVETSATNHETAPLNRNRRLATKP